MRKPRLGDPGFGREGSASRDAAPNLSQPPRPPPGALAHPHWVKTQGEGRGQWSRPLCAPPARTPVPLPSGGCDSRPPSGRALIPIQPSRPCARGRRSFSCPWSRIGGDLRAGRTGGRRRGRCPWRLRVGICQAALLSVPPATDRFSSSLHPHHCFLQSSLRVPNHCWPSGPRGRGRVTGEGAGGGMLVFFFSPPLLKQLPRSCSFRKVDGLHVDPRAREKQYLCSVPASSGQRSEVGGEQLCSPWGQCSGPRELQVRRPEEARPGSQLLYF